MKPLLFVITAAVVMLLGVSSSSGTAHATEIGDGRQQEWSNSKWIASADAWPITTNNTASAWTEIVVDIRTLKDLHGAVELVEVDRYRAEHDLVIDRRDLTLTSSVAQRIHIPALAGRTYRVRLLDEKGVELWYAQEHLREVGTKTVFTMGVDVSSTATSHTRGELWMASLRAMPQSARTYDAVPLFFLEATTLAEIEDRACAPLVDWVRNGGSLVVVHADATASLAHARPRCEQLGPLEPAEPTTTVLGPEHRIGSGRVLTAQTKLLNDAQQLAPLFARASGPQQGRPLTRDLSFITQPKESHAARLAAAGVIILGFGVLAGPVVFLRLRLRRRNKAEQVLALLVVASISTFTGILLLGRVAFTPSARTTTTVIRDFASGEVEGREIHARVFTGPTGPVRTTRTFPNSLIEGDAETGSEGRGRGVFRIENDGKTIVLNERRPTVSDYVYLIESAPTRQSGPVTIGCTSSQCVIENASGTPLDRASLIANGLIFDIGPIDRSATIFLDEHRRTYVGSDDNPSRLDHKYLSRSRSRVALAAWQGETLISVACVTGCEAVR